ncbi:MAG: hypothetical protein DDT30_02009 [Dehalococcoidia bacterium]|nr:hypothetical protein [Bacillota bacterium]MBT9143945.1 hypothetical protein [Bacillota bacterium]
MVVLDTGRFEERGPKFRENIQRNRWGRWKYNPATHCLEIRKRLGGITYDYDVCLDRCDTAARLLDWIYQVKHKRWAGPDDIADLIYAFEDIMGHVQARLCSGGLNLKYNVKKYLSEYVDPLLVHNSEAKRGAAK